MLSTHGVEYPVQFANLQRNSYTSANLSRPKGIVKWTASFADIDARMVVAPRAVLVSGKHVAVASQSDLIVFGSNAQHRFTIPTGQNTPVVLGREAIGYFKPSRLLHCRDYDNKLILELKSIYMYGDYSKLFFLSFTEELGVFAGVQFTGGPHRLPPSYVIYAAPIEQNQPQNVFEGDGRIDNALPSPDYKTVMVLRGVEMTVIDAATMRPRGSFTLPATEVMACSLDHAGNILFVGLEAAAGRGTQVLMILAPTGETIWRYQLENARVFQPPVCSPDGRVYFLDRSSLKCADEGEMLWEKEMPVLDEFFLTVTASGHVICVNGRRLIIFDANGQELLLMELGEAEERFDVPAAVGAGGEIYVTSNQRLYCIE